MTIYITVKYLRLTIFTLFNVMLLRLAMHILFHKKFYVYFLLSLISSYSQDSDLLKKAFCCSIEVPLVFYPGEQCRQMLIDKLKCMSDQA